MRRSAVPLSRSRLLRIKSHFPPKTPAEVAEGRAKAEAAEMKRRELAMAGTIHDYLPVVKKDRRGVDAVYHQHAPWCVRCKKS